MKKLRLAILFAVSTITYAQEAPEATATVQFKAKGGGMNVVFFYSTETEPCEGLSRAAGVYDAELLRAKLLPFIAKLTEKAHLRTGFHPEAEVSVMAGMPIQVLGESKWAGSSGNMHYRGSCGPFTQQFTPEAGHKYLVEFRFSGSSCAQGIADVTDVENPRLVQSQVLECKVPFQLLR
jgi:hypothetical protein